MHHHDHIIMMDVVLPHQHWIGDLLLSLSIIAVVAVVGKKVPRIISIDDLITQ